MKPQIERPARLTTFHRSGSQNANHDKVRLHKKQPSAACGLL